jgi:hypothetical protein
MAATKSATTILSAVTSTQTTTSHTSVSTDYAATMFCKLVVVGTPTGSATFTILESPDGTNYFNGNTYSATLVAGTYYWKVALDPDTQNVDIAFVTQTGGTSSTFTAILGTVTGI